VLFPVRNRIKALLLVLVELSTRRKQSACGKFSQVASETKLFANRMKVLCLTVSRQKLDSGILAKSSCTPEKFAPLLMQFGIPQWHRTVDVLQIKIR
jgi:hypothetical protein